MSKFIKAIQSYRFEEGVIILSGLVAVGISILSFVEWLQLNTNQLLQIAVGGVGLLISTTVILARQQANRHSDLKTALENYVGGPLEMRVFPSVDLGIKHMASRIRTAKSYCDHVSISPPIPRWYDAMQQFEQAVEEVALSNKIRIRYIANFADKTRLQRANKLLSNQRVNLYFVSYFTAESISFPMLNFLIFDGEEIILAIKGDKEDYTLISVKNKMFISAFGEYFDLLWSRALSFDKVSAPKTSE